MPSHKSEGPQGTSLGPQEAPGKPGVLRSQRSLSATRGGAGSPAQLWPPGLTAVPTEPVLGSASDLIADLLAEGWSDSWLGFRSVISGAVRMPQGMAGNGRGSRGQPRDIYSICSEGLSASPQSLGFLEHLF